AQVRLGIDNVVNSAAERQIGELAGRHEIEFGAEEIAAGGRIDQHAKEGDLGRVEGHPSRLNRPLDAPVSEEDRLLILLDRKLRELPNIGIGPLVKNLALGSAGPGDELSPNLLAEDAHLNLQLSIRRVARRPAL